MVGWFGLFCAPGVTMPRLRGRLRLFYTDTVWWPCRLAFRSKFNDFRWNRPFLSELSGSKCSRGRSAAHPNTRGCLGTHFSRPLFVPNSITSRPSSTEKERKPLRNLSPRCRRDSPISPKMTGLPMFETQT